ncbi:MAG: arginyl-tRNA synthetase, partial [Myxococcota bacterium]
ADHHGYSPRVKAALIGLGLEPDRLEILLYQFVSLVEDGQQVKMSTRAGTFEKLADLLDDVGEDVTRCNFVMRKADAQFEFDLKLAKTQSLDNPVFYVQYGHARICTILRKALEAGHAVPNLREVDLSPLVLPEELDLIKKALDYPHVVRSAAENRGPHHIVFYLQELISKFHTYYSKYKNAEKVISDDVAKTAARLALCEALRTVLSSALTLLGVSTPESMYFSE